MFLIGYNVILCLALAAAGGAAAGALIIYLATMNNPNTKTNVLVAGIRMNAIQFSGMYEPMYAVSLGRNPLQRDVFAAWNERVYACDEDNGFKSVFTERFGKYQDWSRKSQKKANKIYAKKAKKLAKIFSKAGIIRDGEQFIVGSETTARNYEAAGNVPMQPGVSYEVLTPCWHLGEDVLERGAVR